MENRRRIAYALIVVVIVMLDQYTKSLATLYLSDGKIVRPFGGDFVWLIHVLNPGFAFGIRILPPIVLKIFAFLASGIIGYFIYQRSNYPFSLNLPLAFIMGGALGNLVDRIRIGEVVDFVSVNMPDFIMDRFPVFNVADSMVSIGVTLLLIQSLFTSSSHSEGLFSSDNVVDHSDDNRSSEEIIEKSLPIEE